MSSDDHHGTKRHAHERAKSRDVTDYFKIGEQINVVIETPPGENGGDEAIASISRDEARDVKIFITPGREPLHRGDHIKCSISHVDSSYLKGVCLGKLW